MDFSIIIPVYNNISLTTKCIQSIQEESINHSLKFEILVIDDGSFDEIPKVIKALTQEYNSIKYLRNDSNLSFTKTCGSCC